MISCYHIQYITVIAISTLSWTCGVNYFLTYWKVLSVAIVEFYKCIDLFSRATDSMQSSTKVGLLTLLTTEVCLNGAILYTTALPQPPFLILKEINKKNACWAQFPVPASAGSCSHRLLVSLSYAQQQLRSLAVINLEHFNSLYCSSAAFRTANLSSQDLAERIPLGQQ